MISRPADLPPAIRCHDGSNRCAVAAAFAGLDASTLEQALIIEYGIGAGIGWHKDRPDFEHVIGISLGSPAVMRFRRRVRSEEHTSELQSLMRISYAVFCLNKTTRLTQQQQGKRQRQQDVTEDHTYY